MTTTEQDSAIERLILRMQRKIQKAIARRDQQQATARTLTAIAERAS